MLKVLNQIDENSFIGELNGVKVYGTVAEDEVFDVYAFPITGNPDFQVTRYDVTYI